MAERPPQPAVPPPPPRRWGRRVLWGALGLLALVLLAGGGALLWALSPPGEAWLRVRGVALANEQLAGRLEAGGAELGLGRVLLTDVRLYDPDGVLVAEIARVEARLALGALVRGEVDLPGARLVRPRLLLAQDARGLNLTRALAPRKPPAEPPADAGPGRLRVEVHALELEDGVFSWEQELEDGSSQVRLEDLDLKGRADWTAATGAYSTALEATASLRQPVAGPVRLALEARGREDTLSGDVRLGAAGLVLETGVSLAGADELRLEVRQLALPPEVARGLVPGWPLRVPLTAQGSAGLVRQVASVALRARAAGASLEVDGGLNLATLRTEGLSARARGVNLAELLRDGPPTSLNADLRVHGGGTRLETLQGQVELTVSPSHLKGQALGPVQLRASAKDGRLTLSRLWAELPGATLSASGGGTLQEVRVKGRLAAQDLATLARATRKLLPGEPLPLSGRGTLDFTLFGAPRAPGVKLSGDFASLAWADAALEGLTLRGQMPDVTRPFSVDGALQVARLRAGGRTLQDVAATVTTGAGRTLEAQVRLPGEAPLSLALGGTVDAGGRGLAVQRLTLESPEATWTLARPTHVGFGEAGVRVAPALELTSGDQALELALHLRGERLEARLDVRALELSRLPRLLVPESLGLGGTLSATLAARGRLPRPEADVELTLTDGRLQQYRGLQLTLRKGRYEGDIASGELSARAPGASASADFRLPVQGLLRRRAERVHLALTLSEVDVGAVLGALGRPEPYQGQLSGEVVLEGTARQPTVRGTLRGQRLRYEGPLPVDVPQPLAFTLETHTHETSGRLQATLQVDAPGAKAHALLHSPITAGELLTGLPSTERLMERKLELNAHLEEVPLALLAGKAARRQRLEGRVSTALQASGTWQVPLLKLSVDAHGVSANGSPPLDSQLEVDAQGQAVRVALTARRHQGKQEVARLRAVLERPLAWLQDPDSMGEVPFSLRGQVRPLGLEELPLPRASPSEALRGTLSLEVQGEGTLGDPRLDVTAGLQRRLELEGGRSEVIQARLDYRYSDARSVLDALLTSPSGGSLVVEGSAKADLSLPAVARLQADLVPLQARVRARKFDVGFLSGLPMVRSLGGLLESDLALAGTLGRPTLEGGVEWKRGRIGLEGLGQYHDIHLALDATHERIRLAERLDSSGRPLGARVRAGTGELRATQAELRFSEGSRMSFSGSFWARDFPLVFDDQLLATLCLGETQGTDCRAQAGSRHQTRVEGDLSEGLVHVRNLTIPGALVELPEVRRKDLQPLEQPGDIVLVRGGQPLRQRQGTSGPELASAGGGAGVLEAGAEDEAEGGAQAAGRKEAQRRYVLNVNAPRNLWVSGSDVKVELGLSEEFRIEYDGEPRMQGDVNVLRGRVDVLGRRFEVQRDSQVRFNGPPRLPYINLTAEHRNEREAVTVFVSIRGQGKDFTLKPTSEPPLAEQEIYTLLATGRRTLKRGSGESLTGTQQAASIVGALVASQARKALADKLPLDVLSIEAFEDGQAGARLEVGKYINDLYLGYRGRVGTTPQQGKNAHEVKLEYQFSPRWGLEAQCGDALACGFDLIWGRDY